MIVEQRYVLTLDPKFAAVLGFIDRHNLKFEPHLNRTRFWVPISGPIRTEFLLWYADHCPVVDQLTGVYD